MPIFKGVSSKATPDKGINYITTEKAVIISTQNIMSDNHAEQFKLTARRFCKAQDKDSRKYYHFKLAFDPKDKVTPEACHLIAEQTAQKFFDSFECVIATHNDKDHIHAHIIVNAVSFVDGSMFHANNSDYRKMKTIANNIAESHGYSRINLEDHDNHSKRSGEEQLNRRDGESWKDELKAIIDFEKNRSTNFDNFLQRIQTRGIEITKDGGKTIAFKYPGQTKAIRGKRLGENYTREALLNGFNEKSDNRGVTNRVAERATTVSGIDEVARTIVERKRRLDNTNRELVTDNTNPQRTTERVENKDVTVGLRKLEDKIRKSRNDIDIDESRRHNRRIENESDKSKRHGTAERVAEQQKQGTDRRKQESEQRSKPTERKSEPNANKIKRSYDEER